MKKLDKYNVCPGCGGSLGYISDDYELVSFNDQTYLATEANCECGWSGMVLWQDPPYAGTIECDELD